MTTYLTAFDGEKRVAGGTEEEMRVVLRAMGPKAAQVLLFDDDTGRQTDIDLREEADRASQARMRGRPALGVKAREVTLLPRHWEWLARQPGGASVTLRKLVEAASRADDAGAAARRAMDAAYAFSTAMAGNCPDYEEAMRALYAGRGEDFARITARWPADIGEHARTLAAPAFTTE